MKRSSPDQAANPKATPTASPSPELGILIPESHAGGHELAATFALLAGFVLMVGLDTTL